MMMREELEAELKSADRLSKTGRTMIIRLDESALLAAARKQLALMAPYSEEIQRRVAEVLDAWAPDLNDGAVERFTIELLDAITAESE